jgi:hypothetical protein
MLVVAAAPAIGCKSKSAGTDVSPPPSASASASVAVPASAAPSASSAHGVEIMPAQHVDVAVDAAQLLKDYKSNELAGDKKYKGKRVRLTGKSGEIKRDLTNTAYLTVGTGAELEIPQAQCFFGEEHAARLASMHPGQVVIVNCEVEGLMMNVLMKDCSFPSVTTYNVCVNLKNAGIATECDTPPGDKDEMSFFTSPSPVSPSAPCPDGSECAKKLHAYVLRSFGTIFLMKDAQGYAAYMPKITAFVDKDHPNDGPRWKPIGSASARIIVALPSAASPALQAKTKAVVDRLPPATE